MVAVKRAVFRGVTPCSLSFRSDSSLSVCTAVLISPQPDQVGNKLQRQKILSFIYPIYNHNCRNVSTIYIYKK